MPRIARMLVKGEPIVYHVMSRTALDGYVLGDVEKEYLFQVIKRLSAVYFSELLGFVILGNHFHILCRMHQEKNYSDEEVERRFKIYYGNNPKKELYKGQIPLLRRKWENLSEYVKDIKQQFSRFYNKRHNRKGFFWAERFKSLIVENGESLINCMAYIDLNPVRAGMVEKPEDYRWCSLGYHIQTNNKDNLLSLDFGLQEFGVKSPNQRLAYYRAYTHDKGGLTTNTDTTSLPVDTIDRFRSRTRYFIDSGVIGSKEFVCRIYSKFKNIFISKNEKQPRPVAGLNNVFSLKRLIE